MIKKIYYLLVTLGLLVALVLFHDVKTANAQTCGGSATCGTRIVRVCEDSSGNPCTEGDFGCVCNDECQGPVSMSCGNYSPPAFCEARGICETYIGVCIISGACTWSGGTTPTPTPGGGGGGGCNPVYVPGGGPFGWGWCEGSCSGGATCTTTETGCACMGGGGGPSCRDVGSPSTNETFCTGGGVRTIYFADWSDPLDLYNQTVCDDPGHIPSINCCPGLVCNERRVYNVPACGGSGGFIGREAWCGVAPVPPPPPTNLRASCPVPGTNASFSWDAASGASDYLVRIDNLANPWAGCAPANPGDICATVSGTSYSTPTTPGANYSWWVFSRNASGTSVRALGPNITCSIVAPTPTPTPVGPGQCEAPVPTDPPAADCAPLGGNTRVYWRWNTVADATEYEIDIQEETGGVFVTMPAFDNDFAAPGSYYTCSGGLCSYETFLPAGNYQSAIRARGICSESDVSDPYVQSVIECPAQAWWQINGGNAITRGQIQSPLPVGENFSLGSYPGVPIYSSSSTSTFDPAGRDSVSSTNWLAGADYNVATFDYSYIRNKIPSYVYLNPLANDVSTGFLVGVGGKQVSKGDYYWHISSGDTTLRSQIIPNRKIIMIVEGGDLNIVEDVRVGADGFLMVIVEGNINIDPSISSIEGIYLADGIFNTGTDGLGNDVGLTIRGSVAAWGGVKLERDLADNSTTPAEVFEFAPEFVVKYPPELGIGDIVWKEVLP